MADQLPVPTNIRLRRLQEARARGTHTRLEWEVLLAIFGGKCVRCGAPRCEKDHIVPLYQGGSDAIGNLQPMCALCNTFKGPDATDWRDKAYPRWREHFDEVFALLGTRKGETA